MDIIVDTREQKPLFRKNESISFKLLVGDYSTLKLRNKFCIERKSLQDLYGTITKGHVRFRNEIIRAHSNGIELILIIEGTRKKFVNKQFPGGSERKIEGSTLDKIMNTIERKYNIEVVWCSGRSSARSLIIKYLKQKEKSL